jgi:hypothetical protein
VVEGVRSMSLDTGQLAYLVLEAANRTQGKGTTVRLVVPRAPEVANELDPTLAEHELLAAEEYLLERGHIAPANIGLTWGTYTLTQAGLEWLEGGFSEEDAALESGLRAEVEGESRRSEEFERELDEARRELVVAQDPPGAAQAVREEPEKEEPRSSTGGAQEGAERPWWRRLLEG